MEETEGGMLETEGGRPAASSLSFAELGEDQLLHLFVFMDAASLRALQQVTPSYAFSFQMSKT